MLGWPEDQSAICYLCLGISHFEEFPQGSEQVGRSGRSRPLTVGRARLSNSWVTGRVVPKQLPPVAATQPSPELGHAQTSPLGVAQVSGTAGRADRRIVAEQAERQQANHARCGLARQDEPDLKGAASVRGQREVHGCRRASDIAHAANGQSRLANLALVKHLGREKSSGEIANFKNKSHAGPGTHHALTAELPGPVHIRGDAIVARGAAPGVVHRGSRDRALVNPCVDVSLGVHAPTMTSGAQSRDVEAGGGLRQ